MLSKTLLVTLTLLSVSGVLSQRGWRVTYTPERICALKGSSVDMRCTYSYPTDYTVQKTLWFINDWHGVWDPQDLSKDSEYSHRVKYLGNKNNDCTFRINQLRETDSETYQFRFLTAHDKYTGKPGVSLEVTDLQVMVYPDTVTDGQSVRLTCSTSCTLTGRPAFIWYRDGSPLSFTDQSHQFRASSEDRGRYTCAVKGYELHSPAVALNVRYSPKSTSVSVSPSGEIMAGSSVTLTCSSDANPPVHRYTWFKKNGRFNPLWNVYRSSYTIEKINYKDAEEYYCVAENVIGTNRSPHINLKVLCLKVEINPDSAREGEMVTLSCKSTCTRRSTFEFYRNGQRLSNIVRNQFRARSDNAGNYSCRAVYDRFLYSNTVILRVKCLV
ncbi:B-cell receptor CD22-like [Anguilla anguilla]|uniref:B-cell receptor CD22-like n=1 Tax=Anguilla anguilla TaxID=7936 RepID=UPI0015AEA86A|nr:B-cell receptor CD22-like [Anguilla anguilla]